MQECRYLLKMNMCFTHGEQSNMFTLLKPSTAYTYIPLAPSLLHSTTRSEIKALCILQVYRVEAYKGAQFCNMLLHARK